LSEHFDGKDLIVKLRDLLFLAGGVAAATQAGALSLGSSQGHVQLGSPLDLVFQVHADPGQTAHTSCVSADIWMGDTAVAASQVLLSTQNRSVRVRTHTPVYEPLITLKLHAGCDGSIARSYTFFADPPQAMAASVQPIDLSKIPVSGLAIASRAIAATSMQPIAASASTAPHRTAKPARPAKRPINPKAFQEAATATHAIAAAAPMPLASSVEIVNALQTPDTPSHTPPPVATAAEAQTPRLRVEPLEGLGHSAAAPTTDDALTATAAHAGAADDAAATTAAIEAQTQVLLNNNATRLEAMELQLQALQQQLSRNRTEINGLQTQLVQAQNEALPMWVHVMLGLLALALATVAWLIQRIKRERQLAHSTWANTVLAAEDAERAQTTEPHLHAVELAASTLMPTSTASSAAPIAPAAAPAPSATHPATSASATVIPSDPLQPSPTHTPTSRTPITTASVTTHAAAAAFAAPASRPSVGSAPAVGASTRAVSTSTAEVLTAQALFDVQEQAEFYASIGENDQAVAILQSHIAAHEASSPLAYLELLQLLHRLSRSDAFEAVREKFQTHFNVQVPTFLGFGRKGSDLWHAYSDVLAKIEAQWPSDGVQALLRALIVRSQTPDASEQPHRFDLEAFDDLLMLYNVAQTTPAASRGALPGRHRSAPLEVPAPELAWPADLDLPRASLGAATTATLPPTAPPLPLDEAFLDLLSPTAAVTPVSALSASPFQSASHFTADEALMDGLTLEWGATDAAPETTQTSASSALDDLDAQLQTLMLDERAPPQNARPSSIP
jgi:pilus assembly protein FimV